MKKLFILFITLAFFFGCEEDSVSVISEPECKRCLISYQMIDGGLDINILNQTAVILGYSSFDDYIYTLNVESDTDGVLGSVFCDDALEEAEAITNYLDWNTDGQNDFYLYNDCFEESTN
jgi:hypothetical protein